MQLLIDFYKQTFHWTSFFRKVWTWGHVKGPPRWPSAAHVTRGYYEDTVRQPRPQQIFLCPRVHQGSSVLFISDPGPGFIMRQFLFPSWILLTVNRTFFRGGVSQYSLLYFIIIFVLLLRGNWWGCADVVQAVVHGDIPVLTRGDFSHAASLFSLLFF